MKLTLSRSESLKSRKLIDQLFTKGKTYRSDMVLVNFLMVDSPKIIQVGFSVPKRKFKNATERNRIKRLLREAYRKNKMILTEQLDKKGMQIALMFVYIGNTEASFEIIEEKIIVILKRLRDKM